MGDGHAPGGLACGDQLVFLEYQANLVLDLEGLNRFS